MLQQRCCRPADLEVSLSLGEKTGKRADSPLEAVGEEEEEWGEERVLLRCGAGARLLQLEWRLRPSSILPQAAATPPFCHIL